MLRASAEFTGTDLDPRGITNVDIDPLVSGGRELIALVDAVLDRRDSGPERAAVRASLGEAALVDAAGVIGNFEMMNRVAEGTGIPVGKGSLQRTEELRTLLDLDRYRHD